MKPLTILALLTLISPASFAQQVPATPKPTSGLTGSSLDQRSSKARMATPIPHVSALALGTSSFNFEAKTVSSGGGTSTTTTRMANSYGIGAQSTDVRESSPILEVKVRNLSSQPGSAHFDWFFVAGDIASSRKFVWDRGERDVAVGGTNEAVSMFESRALEQTTVASSGVQQRINGTNGNYTVDTAIVTAKNRSGSRPAGWIVRMFVGDKLIKVQASSPTYEQIARDPVQLDALLKAPKPGAAPVRPF